MKILILYTIIIIFVYAYICIYIYIYIYKHLYTYIFFSRRTQLNMYVRVHAFINIVEHTHAPVLATDRVCGGCGERLLDAQGYHALCCAKAESTIGHNRLRDCVGAVCAFSDSATTLEAPGLCPRDPALGPADVLTRALHPTMTVAADIGVRAPHAASAGNDPVGSMRMEKIQKYEQHRDDWQSKA